MRLFEASGAAVGVKAQLTRRFVCQATTAMMLPDDDEGCRAPWPQTLKPDPKP